MVDHSSSDDVGVAVTIELGFVSCTRSSGRTTIDGPVTSCVTDGGISMVDRDEQLLKTFSPMVVIDDIMSM